MNTAPSARTVTLYALLVLAVFLVLTFAKLPDYNHIWQEISNLGHVPLFGLLAIAALEITWQIGRGRFTRRLNYYPVAFVLAVFLGLLVELIQIIGPRDADPWDLLLDIVGAAAFLAVRLTWDRRLRPADRETIARKRTVIRIGAVVLVLLALIPLGILVGAAVYRTNNMPYLCNFESSWESRYLRATDADFEVVPTPAIWKERAVSKVGHIRFKPAWYSTFTISEPYPDWTGFSSLEMHLYNTHSTPVRLSIRIDDRQHNGDYADRYNRTLVLDTGNNWMLIPLEEIARGPVGRPLDLEHVARLSLFTSRLTDTLSVYVDDVRLR